jgi:hypothetical protein
VVGFFIPICAQIMLLVSLFGDEPNNASSPLARSFLAGPMKGVDEVVFAARKPFLEPPHFGWTHWYANFGYYSYDRSIPLYHPGGKLCKLNVRTGKLTVLLDDPEGGVRDPAVHYDGNRILFSYRKGKSEYFHLYVIDADGTGLRQLTTGPFDDIEPCWLPDGGIAFGTTRAKRWVNCWAAQVCNIWRCDADGQNHMVLSANLEQDNTPWVLPDGRLLYMRWEYVDRSQENYHHLWAMNPDGTEQTVYFGNFHPGGVYIDAKPIPHSDKVVSINSPDHGQIEHAGFLATVSAKNGPDDLASLKNITENCGLRDPWAFDEHSFMAAHDNRLLLVNDQGEDEAIFTLPEEFGEMWLHEPRPLVRHELEPAIAPRVDFKKNDGSFFLDNVYHGRNMAGVAPGEIKQLLILELLPKPINFSGRTDPVSYGGTFTLERALGTVPVESDGSAYFNVPAQRSVLFVALDAKGRSVKRMLSFTSLQPGETQGCIGCHENRTDAGSPNRGATLAMKRAPSTIRPIADLPDLPDFPRDIQPLLDRYCVSCHNWDKREGNAVLSGDRGPMFSHSYSTLTVFNQLGDARNAMVGSTSPRTLGSGASPLLEKIDGKHYDVRMSDREQRLMRLWIDCGAPYPGTYAALGGGAIGGYQMDWPTRENDRDWPETRAAQPVFDARCVSCHAADRHPIVRGLADEGATGFWPNVNNPWSKHDRHTAFNLTRPEKSLILLAPLARSAGGYGFCRSPDASSDADSEVFRTKGDPGYQTLLAMCEAGKRRLDEITRFDMPGFRPRPEYIREMKRFGILPESFDAAKDRLDPYATDRKYWESLWHRAHP